MGNFMIARAHIFYSGTVQGIGFRYTAQRFAMELGLTGWVRNLKDGRVEIIAEGSRDLINKFLSGLDKRFEGYIVNREIDYVETLPQHKDFSVTP